MLLRALLVVLFLLPLPLSGAWAHVSTFTDAENEWLDRQRAVDGTKCCDRNDAHVGLRVEWRLVGGQYEVLIGGAWRPVRPGRLMQHNPDDPTPWPGQPHLFYSPFPAGPSIWCFFPPPLM